MADEIIPTRKKLRSPDPNFWAEITSKNFLNPAPAITGPAKMNANLAASSLLRPKNNPAEMVEPDLEIPGIRANDWNRPIANEPTIVVFSLVFIFLPNFSARINTKLKSIRDKETIQVWRN